MESLTGKTLAAALQSPFDLDDLEWKVQRCGESNGRIWALVVPYIKSGAIRNRLDELVGPENWKTEKFEAGAAGGLQCGLSLRINGEWITKWDGAENTDYEAVKGGMSGAFKRVARVWGVGRYLEKISENFADITPNGKFSGKTKTGAKFRWNPPGLPTFCLPGQTIATPRSRHRLEDLRRQADALLEQNEPQAELPDNGNGDGHGNGNDDGSVNNPLEGEREALVAEMIQKTRGLKYNGEGAYTHFTRQLYANIGNPSHLSALAEEIGQFLDARQEDVGSGQ